MKVQKHPIAKAIAAVLSAMLAVSCIIDSPLSRKLDELDAALARQKEYTAAFEEGAVPLRDSLLNSKSDSVRWEAAYGIFSIYKCTQMDSALYYLRIMKQLSRDYPHESFLSRVEEAAVNISARNYPAVRTFLAGIDTSALNAKEKDRYYETILLLYATEAHDETLTKEEREHSIRLRHATRRQYIESSVVDPFEAVRRPAIQLYEDGQPEKAIPILKNLIETAPPGLKAHACYSLAKAYQAAGQRQETEFWFAQSAIENIKRPSAEHLSLYELSMMLFEDRHLSRALTYSQAVLESELESHYNTWIINSANSQLGIVRAYNYREKQQKNLVLFITILITLLSLTTFVIGLRSNRQAQKIRRMNRLLEEAGKIKEGYVFRYILLSSQYRRKIEEYRHNLRVTHVTSQFTARVILREHFEECFIGNEASRFTLVVGLLEPPAINNLKVEESHKIVCHREHFHKNMITVIAIASPPHLLVRYNHCVGKSGIYYGCILQQFVFQCVVLSTSRISAPDLQDILLREPHILMGHIPGLDIHIQRHQDKEK